MRMLNDDKKQNTIRTTIIVGIITWVLIVAFAVIVVVIAGMRPTRVAITPIPKSSIISAHMSNVVEVRAGDNRGSGIILERDDTGVVIATANHVTFGTAYANVRFRFNGETEEVGAEHEVISLGYSTYFDVAFFKVNYAFDTDGVLKNNHVRNVLSTSMGDDVLVLGNALGLGMSATEGIVSVPEEIVRIKNDAVTADGGVDLPVIRVSAAINKGVSGGMVVDGESKVIGMALAYRDRTADGASVQNMSYALPIEIVKALYERATAASVTAEIPTMGMEFRCIDVTENNVSRRETLVTLSGENESVTLRFTVGEQAKLTVTSTDGAIEPNVEFTKLNGKEMPRNLTELTAEILRCDPEVGVTLGGDTDVVFK